MNNVKVFVIFSLLYRGGYIDTYLPVYILAELYAMHKKLEKLKFSNVFQAKKGQKHNEQNRFDLIGSLIGRNQRVINHDSLYLTIKGLSRGMLSPCSP